MKLPYNRPGKDLFIVFLFFSFITAMTPSVSSASTNAQNPPAEEVNRQPSKSWHEKIESQWGGHFMMIGSVSWPDDDSIYSLADSGHYYDGSSNFRLKNKTYFNDLINFTTHYEAVLSGGDTRCAHNKLEEIFPNLFKENLKSGSNINDDCRFFDFTKMIDDDKRHIFYHRLDRFFLTLQPDWGAIRIGRQAITWGNGLVFNPIDLFNPFAPTDIGRDYKMGDDMINAQFSPVKIGDLQLLYVPRRDCESHHVKWSKSSLAGKIHFAASTTEFDIIAARHYEDFVTGICSSGYLMDAAWRLDAIWTFLNEDNEKDHFLSLIANMDYSWAWWKKNFYGFIEFYFNGIGNENYSETISDPDIAERLSREDLFILGRKYLSTGIQMETHPLINAYLTVINNLADPSAAFQPRIVWDIAEDMQLTLGGNIYCGPKESEFGGFYIQGSGYAYKASDNVYFWLTYYF